MEEKILELVSPIAEEVGVEVLKVRVSGGRSSRLVQVIVDRRGGVDSESLERVSRGLALQLDVEDLIAGKYRLELTSPGLDWPLETAADFDRYEGDWIKVKFEDGTAIEGECGGAVGDDGFILRKDDGEELQMAHDGVARVIRAINWKRVSGQKK